MTRTRRRQGWLVGLRRFAGVGAALFFVVVLVGTARAQALALASGDEELCFVMRLGGPPVPAFPADPADLADPTHACCDLGLCLDASALPPEAPTLALPCRRTRRLDRRLGRRRAPVPRRRRDHAPRAPPARAVRPGFAA